MAGPPRIFCNSTPIGEIILSEGDSHHLLRVLRLTEGSQLLVVNKATGEPFRAIISQIEPPAAIKILHKENPAQRTCRVKSIYFALCKGDHNDLVVEKCTELGAQKIAFWEAKRSVIRLKADPIEKRLARFERIAEAAAKQCGRDQIPVIEIHPDLNTVLASLKESAEPKERYLYGSLSNTSIPLRNIHPPSSFLHLLIGPEGDLTEEEDQSLLAFGFEPVSLGPLVLRAETAAISFVAMVNGMWGEIQTSDS